MEPEAPGREASHSGSSPGKGPLKELPKGLTLVRYDWSGLIGRNFLDHALTGSFAAALSVLFIYKGSFPTIPSGAPEGTPAQWTSLDPFLVHPLLTLFCLALGYLRIWKTLHEEHETNAIWATISREDTEDGPEKEGVGSRGEGKLVREDSGHLADRVFEVPYLLAINALSWSAAVPQVFFVVLAMFYLSDNYYNAALIRGVVDLLNSRTPASTPVRARAAIGALLFGLFNCFIVRVNEKDRAGLERYDGGQEIVRYLQLRHGLDVLLFLVALATFLVTFLGPLDRDGQFIGLLAVTCVILVLEWIVEPFRHLNMKFS